MALFTRAELAEAEAMRRHLAGQLDGQLDVWAAVADDDPDPPAVGCGCACSWGQDCAGCGHAYCGQAGS